MNPSRRRSLCGLPRCIQSEVDAASRREQPRGEIRRSEGVSRAMGGLAHRRAEQTGH